MESCAPEKVMTFCCRKEDKVWRPSIWSLHPPFLSYSPVLGEFLGLHHAGIFWGVRRDRLRRSEDGLDRQLCRSTGHSSTVCIGREGIDEVAGVTTPQVCVGKASCTHKETQHAAGLLSLHPGLRIWRQGHLDLIYWQYSFLISFIAKPMC